MTYKELIKKNPNCIGVIMKTGRFNKNIQDKG